MTDPSAAFRATYGRDPEIITRAPGRIEFIGNHTDYNQGTVLGAAIDRAVVVALARRSDGRRRFASDRTRAGGAFSIDAADLRKIEGRDNWINYPLGVLAAFPQFGLTAPAGFDFLVTADLPPGAGLSSSAALELSSALAFAGAAGENPSREVLVRAARHAENHFVGVPCGILDQGVSGFGRAGHLVFIDCRGPRFETVPMPPGAHFWIFNTHTKHALVDGLYAARHAECMAAAQTLGVAALADLTPGELTRRESELAPLPRLRARHIVDEIARVGQAVSALGAGDLAAVGRLLTASHRSSQRYFENSTPELDFLVDQLTARAEVYGARLTGGGFGGAVMALTNDRFGSAAADAVAAAYATQFGERPDVLHTVTANGAEILHPKRADSRSNQASTLGDSQRK